MLLTFMRRRRSATLLAAFVLLPSSACIDLGKDYVEKQQYVLEVELPGRSISPTTIDEIIAELETTDVAERSGRAMDHEVEDAFERLRVGGYM